MAARGAIRRRRWVLLLGGIVLALGLVAAPAFAQLADEESAIEDFFEMEGMPDDLQEPWREFIEGWTAFGSWQFVAQELVSLGLAALLGASIAFHPRRFGVDFDRQDLEQPKVIILYAVIGAAVSEIVLFNPPMAFVVFGIGGLMRFRTLIGAPKDTGYTIFAAVMGLACGLKMFPLAVLGTAFAWALIWALEARVPALLEVRRVPDGELQRVVAAWRQQLEDAGCSVQRERLVEAKGRADILVLAPRSLDLEGLRDSAPIPHESGGRASWKHD